jgi:uncharacterized protein YbjT (DUF2867 family)
MKQKIVTLVGGSGFVGRHLVKALCDEGYTVRVLCRDTIAAESLTTAGTVGQVVLQHADITTPTSLSGAFAGSFAVINLVSTLYSRGKQNFKALNVTGAEAIAKEAATAGATRLIHFSALGIEQAQDTQYGRTKLQGEAAVKAAFPATTFFRPSIIFGHGDGFFERFARMSSLSPALPVIGGGKTLFQPIYVEDVALAVVATLARPDTAGNTYALAGTKRYSFKTLLQMILDITGRKRLLARLPSPIASLMGGVSELLPFPPAITRDQVRILAHDNIQREGDTGIDALGITPRALESLLPEILKRYHV